MHMFEDFWTLHIIISLHDGTMDQWGQDGPRIGDAFVVRRQLEELKRAECKKDAESNML